MNENNENLKEKFSAWWKENGDKVKIGVNIGLACLAFGFVRGVLMESKINADTMKKMIDKIPYEPDECTIAEYISEHVEELKPIFEAEKQAYEDLLN